MYNSAYVFVPRAVTNTSSEYFIRTGSMLLYVYVLTELAAKGAGAGWQWHLYYLHFFPPLSHTRGVSIRQARPGYAI